jgi:hypothetical protein
MDGNVTGSSLCGDVFQVTVTAKLKFNKAPRFIASTGTVVI